MRFAELMARFRQFRSDRRGMAPPPNSDLSTLPGQVSAAGVITPGGNVIRDVTAAEAATLGISLPALVMYNPADTRGLVYILNGTPAQITGATMTAGVITGSAGYSTGSGNLRVGSPSQTGTLTTVGGISTVALGIGAFRGIDARKNVGATDGAAITVYAVPSVAANLAYRLTARVFGFGGTVTGASYVVTWTEGGVGISKTLTITAVDTDADLSIGIQPDASTNVTAQITALTGTTPKINVLCLVEGLAAGT